MGEIKNRFDFKNHLRAANLIDSKNFKNFKTLKTLKTLKTKL